MEQNFQIHTSHIFEKKWGTVQCSTRNLMLFNDYKDRLKINLKPDKFRHPSPHKDKDLTPTTTTASSPKLVWTDTKILGQPQITACYYMGEPLNV